MNIVHRILPAISRRVSPENYFFFSLVSCAPG
jgi:hypothetical protein